MNLKTFIENFDAIAEAPDGIPKLRSLILDLAVRGKLVPHTPDDEPASVLIERALKNREKLTSENKISKRQPQPSVRKEEIPFELPEGWECIRFGEITDIVSGVTKGRKLAGRETALYPYLRVANVQRGYLDLEVIKEIEIPMEELEKYRLQIGDVLLTEGGDWDKLGRSTIWQGEIEDCIHQNHVFRARPLDNDILPEWIVMFTNSATGRQYFESAAKQTTNLASINMTQLRFYPFVVPPIAEQKRIVAKVNELMALCDRYEAAKQTRDNLRQKLRGSAIASLMNAETDEELDADWAFVRDNWQNLSQQPEDVEGLRQSILQLAVQGKLLPQEPSDDSASVLLEKINFSRRLKWEKKQLEEFSKKGKKPSNETWKAKYPEPDSLDVNDLPNIPESWEWCSLSSIAEHIVDGTHHTPTYVDNGIPFISAKDIINGQIHFEHCRMIPETEYMALSQRCNPQIGNLLVTKSGTIGRVAIVKTGEKFTLFESVALVPLLDLVEPDYIAHVAYLSCSGEFGKTNQKGMAVRHLHLKELRQLPIPLPPLAEQKRIVAKIHELMQLCDQLEASLRQSQQRAESLAASAISHMTI